MVINDLIRTPDGFLEARVNQGDLAVSSPRAPSIRIRLVDHTSNFDYDAPKGAIYQISVFNPKINSTLNDGDVHVVYVGREGILIADSGKKRIVENYPKKD